MNHRRRSLSTARAAFTLVEVLIALTIAAIVSTAAMAMFLTVRTTAIETAARAQLARDGQVVLDLITHDLLFFGAGVPLGVNGDPSTTAASGESLLPIIRVARDDNLVFLGDLPYPNAELPGLASLAYVGDDGSDAHRPAVTSETSGFCIPPVASATMLACRTSVTTLLPGLQSAADCTSTTPPIDSTPSATDLQRARTCPWGMNKWLPANGGYVYLTIVDSNGKWHERRNKSGTIGNDDVDGLYLATHLEEGFPAGSNAQDLDYADFFAGAGGSYVTVMDRVFYAVEDTANPGTRCTGAVGGDCSLRRRQCWGRLDDPTTSGFPAAGTSSFVGSSSTQSNCTITSTPEDGTRWETVVSGVEDITFSYYADATTLLAGAGTGHPLTSAQATQIKAIEVEVRVSRRVPGSVPARFLSDVYRRRYFLPNQQ